MYKSMHILLYYKHTQAAPGDAEKAVLAALEAGYRHIDTATVYKNEKEVGNAIQSWLKCGAGRREELFVTTKLPHIGNRPNDVKIYCTKSLQSLQLEYLDLYLVHMPFTFKPDDTGEAPAKHNDGTFVLEETDHKEIWNEMESLVKSGLVRSIGVSNFNSKQLERLLSFAEIQPAVLQVELHVALQQPELQQLCRNSCVTLTAYSPLGSPGSKDHFKNKYGRNDFDFPDILNDPRVIEIAERLKRTPAQVLLKFLVQQEIAVIPKSVNPQRIIENSQIFDFELPQEDIERLQSLDRGPKGRIVNFLFFKGVECHAEYPFVSELQQ
ncbi:1,5-anhydro-D-fructose reductase-like isoform X2 [Macrosteles quadrilineatus]|uniref:1,5-anhydro-D-fructose reductase-like isoform X2 n=1 Tax=Macrosteles quadrilineatus TaxID=74068 RepID=UPI0023E2F6BA|nr:1,5-anhydro-D-fructose reductase-like isoform X2 [Macrosteles quadrilineatus]